MCCRGAGASELQAAATARSIRDAEADGIRNVGLGYLPVYASHVACGKVRGDAVPTVVRPRPAIVAVDAGNGFCHPAFEAGLPALLDATRTSGIGLMSIAHSYSAGVVGWVRRAPRRRRPRGDDVRQLVVDDGAVGRSGPVLRDQSARVGVPRRDGAAIVADLSSAAVAWVTLKDHADRGAPIPPTWALDTEGRPTTDAAAGLAGSVAPGGWAQGSALALLVDLLAGGHGLGVSRSSRRRSVTTPAARPDVGQLVVASTRRRRRVTGSSTVSRRSSPR